MRRRFLSLFPGVLGAALVAAPAPAQPDPDVLGAMQYRMVGPSRGRPRHRGGGTSLAAGDLLHGRHRRRRLEDHRLRAQLASDLRRIFQEPPIGAIGVAESDPNIVYVTTGSDGLRSNVIIGKGVYRSDDAGKTWQNLGLEETGSSGAVLIHPEDPDRAWIAQIGTPSSRIPSGACIARRTGARTGSWGVSFRNGPARGPGVQTRRPRHDLRLHLGSGEKAVDDQVGWHGGRCAALPRRRRHLGEAGERAPDGAARQVGSCGSPATPPASTSSSRRGQRRRRLSLG